MEYGQGKRGRLAAAGLSQVQDVLTGEDTGNAVVLDCGGFLHPELFASLGCPFGRPRYAKQRYIGLGFGIVLVAVALVRVLGEARQMGQLILLKKRVYI